MKIIYKDGTVAECPPEEELHVLRHSAAHIMAQAIKRLFPEADLAFGPATQNGFYYDVDLGDRKLTQEDLDAIEKEMKKITKENLPFKAFILNREDAKKLMTERGEKYKLEHMDDLADETEFSFFQQGEYVDMCLGPHLLYTKALKAFKITQQSGAYWKDDKDNKMLTRINGVAFRSTEELDAYMKQLEEAKKRDHRKLGKELGLYAFRDEAPGFPFYLPKGMVLRNTLIDYWRKVHKKWDYVEISTPQIMRRTLWETSGHWDHYKDNMYFVKIDDEDYAIKPMNCPGSILVYKRKLWSYRELPVRYAEMGQVHRHELSGALHGLMRVRTFVQDDAHIFMLPEQTRDEVVKIIQLYDDLYKLFNLPYHIELSTMPDDHMGTEEEWAAAENALKEAIESIGVPYVINEGDGAFYGPKLDFHLEDSIGRTWQCGTLQLDMQMPQRFDINYIGPDGEKHRPLMIHRAAFGSVERFIGILIEHFAGKFPLWLAPVQVRLMTVTEKFTDYAQEIAEQFEAAGIRVECDIRNEKIGYKIREARNERVPYMCIIGEKEVEGKILTVRNGKTGGQTEMTPDELQQLMLEEIKSKAL